MQDKLPRGLYALVDDSVRPDLPLLVKARAFVEGGVPVLQVRLKQTPDRDALVQVRAVVALARPARTVVLVNDRVDLALAAGADGVHLGDDDLPPDVARRLLGPAALIGVTTRSLEDIERAKALGADHVGLGPVFGTRTKVVNAPELGLEAFGRLCRASPLPVVGIAGITLARVPEVARAGAHCAAVASALVEGDAAGLVSRAQAFVRAFSGHP